MAIKREMFATAAPGLEQQLDAELDELGIQKKRVIAGGVAFLGEPVALYRANLWLRTAGRVILRLDHFFVQHLSALQKHAKQMAWEEWLRGEVPISVRATCHKSRIYHSVAAAERVAEGIAFRLRLSLPPSYKDGAPDESGGAQTVLVRIARDYCTISLDSSGAHLHRRGYRTESVEAPIRENLAAAVLMLGEWRNTEPLVDPMCGSGTIPIEAAMRAAHMAPGMHRRFAFMDWPGFDAALFTSLVDAAKQAKIVPVPRIRASDIDGEAIRIARRNAESAGVSAFIELEQRDFRAFKAEMAGGLIICNPPYGKRVGDSGQLRALHADLGRMVRRQPPDWRLSLLTNDQRYAAATGLTFIKTSPPFPNGGLRVKVYSTTPNRASGQSQNKRGLHSEGVE